MSKGFREVDAYQARITRDGMRNDLVQNYTESDHSAPYWLDVLTEAEQGSSDFVGDDTERVFPFVCDHFDPKDQPSYQLYRCHRDVVSSDMISQTSVDKLQRELVEQIRGQLNSQYRINVSSEQILLTQGREQALTLLADELVSESSVVALENPGRAVYQTVFQQSKAQVQWVDVDQDGLTIGDALNGSNIVCVTPSSHYPTSVTMSLNRRQALLEQASEQGFYIIEDMCETDTHFLDQALPLLHRLDAHDRVISVGCLSSSTAPQLDVGYILAPKEMIARLSDRQPTTDCNALSMAITTQFLALGYYDNHIRRVRHTMEQKWLAMLSALECHMPDYPYYATPGSTCFLLTLPQTLDCHTLITRAAMEGIVLQADNVRLNSASGQPRVVLGFGAINIDDIEAGIMKLKPLITTLCQPM
ncbi:PLP-dependent aminotransferase family protein [Vibrio hippocampi]|uniref:HTH-type transcriptional regulator TauR n=1 Tax=Vibrio hippocampi TaxID=654686 RepID=A0ABM8ZMV4_9VIBR|nr:PLP-dependent aminotransferase family protein [Vibrio hippocampi]CAH0529819.1 HTH-type transcriptional regulator TauR [Vibrio hippocampi]